MSFHAWSPRGRHPHTSPRAAAQPTQRTTGSPSAPASPLAPPRLLAQRGPVDARGGPRPALSKAPFLIPSSPALGPLGDALSSQTGAAPVSPPRQHKEPSSKSSPPRWDQPKPTPRVSVGQRWLRACIRLIEEPTAGTKLSEGWRLRWPQKRPHDGLGFSPFTGRKAPPSSGLEDLPWHLSGCRTGRPGCAQSPSWLENLIFFLAQDAVTRQDNNAV